MHRTTMLVLATAIVVTVFASAAFAYRTFAPLRSELSLRGAHSLDLVKTPEAAALRDMAERARAKPNPWGVAHDTVGDADSYGRANTYFGVMSNLVSFDSSCPRANPLPGERCVQLHPIEESTWFQIDDLATVDLPRASAESLLCHWLTVDANITYQNTTAAIDYGSLHYVATVIVYNPVLEDRSLINPATGEPFAGSIMLDPGTYGMLREVVLPNSYLEAGKRDTTTCVEGLIMRKWLTHHYGLSNAQADAFFAAPMTLQLGVRGFVHRARWGTLALGMRVMGDARM